MLIYIKNYLVYEKYIYTFNILNDEISKHLK